MIIKFCTDEEYLEQMVNFQVKMAMETEDFQLDPDIVREGIKTQINKPDTGRYLLAIKDEKLLGMLLTLYEWSDWRCKNVIWVHSVYVIPEARGEKVFKKMYEFLQNEVSQDGTLAGIRLYVDKTNLNAQEVYKKVGMNDQHYALFEWMK